MADLYDIMEQAGNRLKSHNRSCNYIRTHLERVIMLSHAQCNIMLPVFIFYKSNIECLLSFCSFCYHKQRSILFQVFICFFCLLSTFMLIFDCCTTIILIESDCNIPNNRCKYKKKNMKKYR